MPKLTAPAGPFRCEVWIAITSAGEMRVPPSMLIVKGTILQQVRAHPDQLRCGVRQVGQTFVESIRLVPESGEAFQVTGIHTASPEIVIQRKATASNEQAFEIVTTPKGNGDVSHVVLFDVALAGHKRIQVPVTVSYHATDVSLGPR